MFCKDCKDNVFSIILSAFSSVYTNTRIGKIKLLKGLNGDAVEKEIVDKRPSIVPVPSKTPRESVNQMELISIKDSQSTVELGQVDVNDEKLPLKDNHEDEIESKGVKDLELNQPKVNHKFSFTRKMRKLIRLENDYKLADRSVFTTIITVEQIVIFLIIKLSPFSERVEDTPLLIFYCAIIPLFILGQLLEAIYYTYLNPEAKYRQRVGCRKTSLSLTLFTLFVAGIVAILYLLYNLEQFGYFIIILTIIVVLILSIVFYVITCSCCKRY